MAEHILKTLPVYWHAIDRGDKNFEVRRDDRGFQKGDVLVLRKLKEDGSFAWKDAGVQRIGANAFALGGGDYYDLRRRVSYILTGAQFGIEAGYVVMGLATETDPSPEG